jgi:hypothetical protein
MSREYPLDLIASITSGEVNKAPGELEDVCKYLGIPFSIRNGKEYVYNEIKEAVEVQNKLLTKIVPALADLNDAGDVQIHLSADAVDEIVFKFRQRCSKFMAGIITRSI